MSDMKVIRAVPQNRPSFPFDRATPPAPLSFAIQKRPLASFLEPYNTEFRKTGLKIRFKKFYVPEFSLF